MDVVNQMWLLGETLHKVVEKIMVSMLNKFEANIFEKRLVAKLEKSVVVEFSDRTSFEKQLVTCNCIFLMSLSCNRNNRLLLLISLSMTVRHDNEANRDRKSVV